MIRCAKSQSGVKGQCFRLYYQTPPTNKDGASELLRYHVAHTIHPTPRGRGCLEWGSSGVHNTPHPPGAGAAWSGALAVCTIHPTPQGQGLPGVGL